MKGLLGGGFNFFIFSTLFGDGFQFDSYFSNGLEPPTSIMLLNNPLVRPYGGGGIGGLPSDSHDTQLVREMYRSYPWILWGTILDFHHMQNS